MYVLEYQAKPIVNRFGINVPLGHVANDAADAEQVAIRLGCSRYAVKSQIPVANRQAVGGVGFAQKPADVRALAAKLSAQRLDGTMWTKAAGGEPPATKVYVEEVLAPAQELYVAAALDRASGGLVLLASPAGGSRLEARAKLDPSLIHTLPVKLVGMRGEADFAGLAAKVLDDPAQQFALTAVLRNVVSALITTDATQIEINPLAVTTDGRLVALDVKMTVDDNALPRRAELASIRHANEVAARTISDLEAQRYHLNLVTLGGDIGTACNGAGLALATLDLIEDAGGHPANFMDIRTTANTLDIAYGFGMLLANQQVRALLVNVHGGGMQRCDTIAEGLGIAVRKASRSIPIVIRMAGNNAAYAKTVLANHGVNYVTADSMEDAAAKVVALVRKEAA